MTGLIKAKSAGEVDELRSQFRDMVMGRSSGAHPRGRSCVNEHQ
jgi:hypothetical protein